MEHINTPIFDLAYDLCKTAESGDIQYIYRGKFSQDITNEILELTETNLTQPVDNKSAKKKIYFIMVEGLQNITRHQYEAEQDTLEESSLFILQKDGDHYFVTTGNLIENRDVTSLKEKLDKVNSLTPDELRQISKERLLTGDISLKGGAGLGLIEMARKSGGKLHYDFRKVNNKYSFFYFNTEIFTAKDESPAVHVKKISLENVKDLHKILNKENILLNFVGTFNQDTLLNFVGLIEQKMEITARSLKVIKIMTEMFQNIVIHGENINNNPAGTLGIFFVSEKDGKFIMTSGNYIKNDNAKTLAQKIEDLNKMSDTELDKIYKQVMFDRSSPRSSKGAGLGYIDMRIKSKNIIAYNFRKLNEEYSFYTLQVKI